MRTLRLVLLAALVGAGGCSCTPPDPSGTGSPVGEISTRSVEGGFELVLAGLERPVTALQVDVELEGARATAIEPAGEVSHDLLEAGLTEPRSTFTAVVSDTRRLLLAEGAVAKIATDAAATPRLTRAVAVDDQGQKRGLTVVVR